MRAVINGGGHENCTMCGQLIICNVEGRGTSDSPFCSPKCNDMVGKMAFSKFMEFRRNWDGAGKSEIQEDVQAIDRLAEVIA